VDSDMDDVRFDKFLIFVAKSVGHLVWVAAVARRRPRTRAQTRIGTLKRREPMTEVDLATRNWHLHRKQ
jgi:hypothetical protein